MMSRTLGCDPFSYLASEVDTSAVARQLTGRTHPPYVFCSISLPATQVPPVL